MNTQDTNIPLQIDVKGEIKEGMLKMQHNNGNVSLSFFKEVDSQGNSTRKKYSQIPDRVNQLSDFTKVELDPDNQLALLLSGSRCQFKLIFKDEAKITTFFDYIGQKVSLKHSDCNPRVFLLESLDTTQQTINPFMATILPKPKTNTPQNRISHSKIKEMVQNLKFDKESDVKFMSKENYNSLFDNDGKIQNKDEFQQNFYNVDVDPCCAGELWQLVLQPELMDKTKAEREEEDQKNLDIYQKVKKQWFNTSKKQWDNHTDLRKLVALLEEDIKAHDELFTQFENKHEVQKLAFNVLLTLSYYNWDHGLYTKGLITFLIPFLEPFVKDADGTNVTTHDGNKIEQEKAESAIFWCFFRFYENNMLYDMVKPSKTPKIKEIFKKVGEELQNNYTNLLELLFQKHAYSLDFLRDDCNAWFSTCFKPKDLRRLWVSILTYGQNQYQFFGVFIISLLIYFSEDFVSQNPLNSEEFIRIFEDLKKKLDEKPLVVLLDNAKILMQKQTQDK